MLAEPRKGVPEDWWVLTEQRERVPEDSAVLTEQRESVPEVWASTPTKAGVPEERRLAQSLNAERRR